MLHRNIVMRWLSVRNSLIVAMGYFDERTVIQGWLSSPAHCANIMNPLVKEMGVAYNGKYWTQVFGSEE